MERYMYEGVGGILKLCKVNTAVGCERFVWLRVKVHCHALGTC